MVPIPCKDPISSRDPARDILSHTACHASHDSQQRRHMLLSKEYLPNIGIYTEAKQTNKQQQQHHRFI
eukprot:scaffold439425_cov38-Prasinocladus_malaysianus.AAC.1